MKVIRYRGDWLQVDAQYYIPGWGQGFSVHRQIKTNFEDQGKANYPPESPAEVQDVQSFADSSFVFSQDTNFLQSLSISLDVKYLAGPFCFRSTY
jgi:hypothetical protein